MGREHSNHPAHPTHGEAESFYLLYLYAKNEQGDLTAAQSRQLARLVRKEFK